MQKAAFVFLPVLFVLAIVGQGDAQIFRTTPTRTPTPTPSATATPRPVPCPNVSIQAQSGQRIRDGQQIFFALNIAGGDPRAMPIIMWSTNAGSITNGQGTRRIQVDTTGAGTTSDRQLKAEVWVSGYAPECVLQASATVMIIPPAFKFGEFGEVDEETFKRNMEALSAYLSQSQDNLYVIAYSGRNSERGFSYNWIRKIREKLIADRVEPRRIGAVDGGYREEPLLDFWIVPLGSQPPRPAPTLRRDEVMAPRNTTKKP